MENCIRIVDIAMSDNEIPTERFFKLEQKVDHMESGQQEMAKDVKKTSESMKGIEIAMTELALIAKQNQALKPEIDGLKESKADNSRVDKLEEQQAKNTKFIIGATAVIGALTLLARYILPLITK